jgi:hypothetical protein
MRCFAALVVHGYRSVRSFPNIIDSYYDYSTYIVLQNQSHGATRTGQTGRTGRYNIKFRVIEGGDGTGGTESVLEAPGDVSGTVDRDGKWWGTQQMIGNRARVLLLG